MQELTIRELQEVRGGITVETLVVGGIRITGIAVGLTAFAVAGAVIGSFSAGYWVGGHIYRAAFAP